MTSAKLNAAIRNIVEIQAGALGGVGTLLDVVHVDSDKKIGIVSCHVNQEHALRSAIMMNRLNDGTSFKVLDSASTVSGLSVL